MSRFRVHHRYDAYFRACYTAEHHSQALWLLNTLDRFGARRSPHISSLLSTTKASSGSHTKHAVQRGWGLIPLNWRCVFGVVAQSAFSLSTSSHAMAHRIDPKRWLQRTPSCYWPPCMVSSCCSCATIHRSRSKTIRLRRVYHWVVLIYFAFLSPMSLSQSMRYCNRGVRICRLVSWSTIWQYHCGTLLVP